MNLMRVRLHLSGLFFVILALPILAMGQTGISGYYPPTARVAQTDIYHGQKVEDPYRWLENDTAAAVNDWINAQNRLTDQEMAKISFIPAIKERLLAIFNHERFTAPLKVGPWYFFRKNSGLQNQSVIYRQKGLKGTPVVFIDPNHLSADGTVTAELSGYSPDHKFIVVSISKSGSDWQELEVYETATGIKLKDKIEWVKFSGAAWTKDGFFYSRYDKPAEGKAFSNKNEFHKIYFHKLGTDQSKDVLVYWDKKHPQRYFGCSVSRNEQYLFVSGSEGTSGNELWFKDLKNPQGNFIKLCTGFGFNYDIVETIGSEVFILTDKEAPTYRLVKMNLKNPIADQFQTVIPSGSDLLQSVQACGGKFFAHYLHNVSTKVVQYSISGQEEKEISLPGIGTASGFGGEPKDSLTFYTFSSYNYPTTIFSYHIKKGTSQVFFRPNMPFQPEQFEVKQEFYLSKDGTSVPMFLVHKKGLKYDGNRPTLLYGYGGFNISLTPGFSAAILPLLESDGIYVVANLRGGGEFGESWHKAGMLEKKQNVFDDFIAAAEHLIRKGYTKKERLAIEGRSNGGLLVGACMTQRPDLFQVAFPGVGVLDMLRFHKFTIGWGWVVEYGSADSSHHFPFLYKYSPLHNVKPGTFPATLVSTADHDDRVVPAHSFKFIAALQYANRGTNPTLIRISRKAGHGAGKPLSKSIDELAEKWGFMLYHMGLAYERP